MYLLLSHPDYSGINFDRGIYFESKFTEDPIAVKNHLKYEKNVAYKIDTLIRITGMELTFQEITEETTE